MTHPPHIAPIEPGEDFCPLPEVHDIASIEIGRVDLGETPGAITVLMAALTPDHYAELHGPARGAQERGLPVYFAHRADGLALHPRALERCWVRVTYRAPIGRESRAAPEAN